MATNFFKIKNGENLQPVTGSTVTVQGDVAYNSSSNQVEVYTTAAESISTASNTQTLTNKSISTGGTNTIGATTISGVTGTTNIAMSNGPTLVAPVLGTPASGTLTNCTGLPAAALTGQVAVANGGTGVATASANTLFSGPTSGSATAPAFRVMTSSDIVESRNLLLNSDFGLFQRGTSITVANGAVGYVADRWYVNNGLGTSGVVTSSRQTASVDGSQYALKYLVSTAPVGSFGGAQVWYTFDNADSLNLYNKTASFAVQVKAFGNATQIGVQFFSNTSEASTGSAIGSEQTFTISTGAYATASISGQALGTAMTTSGVIAVRIRITAVSSGNIYDLNNGFQLEQPIVNIGTTPAAWKRAYPNWSMEIQACQRYYEKSYNVDVDPATSTTVGAITHIAAIANTIAQASEIGRHQVKKRVNPTVTIYSTTGASGKVRNITTSADINGSASSIGTNGFFTTVDAAGVAQNDTWAFHWVSNAEIT